MNKKSHMIFTEQMNPTMHVTCGKFLQIGCILPDILVYTYLRGHKWNTSGKKILRKLETLEEWGVLNIWSSLRLGMVLHYLEDYFTMVHSEFFHGNILEHVQYETKLLKYIKNGHQSEKDENYTDFSYDEIQSAESLSKRLTLLQKAYQQEISALVDNEDLCFETDLKYMKVAVQSALGYVIPLMNRKTVIYRQLVGEAMTRMPQQYGV